MTTPDAATVEQKAIRLAWDFCNEHPGHGWDNPCARCQSLAQAIAILHAQAVAELEQQVVNWRNDFQLACRQCEEAEQAVAAIEDERDRYRMLYYDTKKALDTLRAVRTQRGQDVAAAVAAVERERDEARAVAVLLERMLDPQQKHDVLQAVLQAEQRLAQAVREEREKHTFPFCEDSGHAICYQCAAAVRHPREGT
jgi:hypothetical protein